MILLLADKINVLFELLQCKSVEIAALAGFDPSYLSHLRRGSRKPKPNSRPVARLADGIYRFCDREGKLKLLAGLCQCERDTRDYLVPALIGWFFDADKTEEEFLAARRVADSVVKTPDYSSFGEKFDAVMKLLDLSNARLARRINVDNSLVSRFRSGLRSPRGNKQMAAEIVDYLLSRAEEQDKMQALAELSQLPQRILSLEEGPGLFAEWLYEEENQKENTTVDRLLESIDMFNPTAYGSQQGPMYTPPAELAGERRLYWNFEGLRAAVYRFLTEVSEEGGELWLYSDEDMGWMIKDPKFFNSWANLMLACIRRRVRIKVIHNIDRSMDEMLEAIKGWMPLYMSGLIESYISSKPRDKRFKNTFFLCPGKACIRGMYAGDRLDNRWYDYITEPLHLKALELDFDALLTDAEYLLRILLGQDAWKKFRAIPETDVVKARFMLSSLPPETLPEAVLERMLKRSIENPARRRYLTELLRNRREARRQGLAEGTLEEFVCLPSDEALFGGEVMLNLGMELLEDKVYYTPEDFAEHVRAMRDLAEEEKHYQLFILPELPFPDIQIMLREKSTAILRCKSPHAAFVFTEPLMCHTINVYFERLKKQYALDPSGLRAALNHYY